MKVTLADKKMILKRLGKGHEVCNLLESHERKALRASLNDVNELAKLKKNPITREQADALLRSFRTNCLEFGKYPDYVLIEFLNKEFGELKREKEKNKKTK